MKIHVFYLSIVSLQLPAVWVCVSMAEPAQGDTHRCAAASLDSRDPDANMVSPNIPLSLLQKDPFQT